MRHYSATAQPTTLSTSCTDSATTIQVTATTGLPAVDFTLAIEQEVVLVTDVSGTTLTVTRGYDGSPAVAHSTGATVQHVHSAVDFREAQEHIAATSGVHGTTGEIVDTTATQTLSHKDLSAGTNTFPSSLATDTEVSSAVSGALTTAAGYVSTHAAATSTHGVTGAVVGTSDAQALTNKTVALGSNTLSGTTAQFNAANTDGDFATLAGAETLSSKTLASPVITGVGEVRYIPKVSDESRSSTTTFTNDSVLTFTAVANAIYLIEGDVLCSTLGGGGVKLQLALPAAAFYWEDGVAVSQSSPVGQGGTTGIGAYEFAKRYRVQTVGTAGSVTLQWAQNSSNATATKVLGASWWRVTRIA